MFCKNCGKEIPDNATFCTYCGAQVAAPQQQVQQPQQPVYQQPTYQQPQQPVYQQPAYQQPVYQQPGYAQAPYESPEGKSASTAALVWGIVSLVCSWGPIIGIIFSCIGMSQAKKAERLGVNNSTTKAGKIMSIIALVFSIIAIVVWIICIIAALTATAYSNSFYY